MFKKNHWMVGFLALFFVFNAHAKTCSHAIDCGKWEPENCACGVHAKCHGVTNQSAVGECRCFGAEGACHSSSPGSVRIRQANPIRRTHPVKQDREDTRIQTDD